LDKEPSVGDVVLFTEFHGEEFGVPRCAGLFKGLEGLVSGFRNGFPPVLTVFVEYLNIEITVPEFYSLKIYDCSGFPDYVSIGGVYFLDGFLNIPTLWRPIPDLSRLNGKYCKIMGYKTDIPAEYHSENVVIVTPEMRITVLIQNFDGKRLMIDVYACHLIRIPHGQPIPRSLVSPIDCELDAYFNLRQRLKGARYSFELEKRRIVIETQRDLEPGGVTELLLSFANEMARCRVALNGLSGVYLPLPKDTTRIYVQAEINPNEFNLNQVVVLVETGHRKDLADSPILGLPASFGGMEFVLDRNDLSHRETSRITLLDGTSLNKLPINGCVELNGIQPFSSYTEMGLRICVGDLGVLVGLTKPHENKEGHWVLVVAVQGTMGEVIIVSNRRLSFSSFEMKTFMVPLENIAPIEDKRPRKYRTLALSDTNEETSGSSTASGRVYTGFHDSVIWRRIRNGQMRFHEASDEWDREFALSVRFKKGEFVYVSGKGSLPFEIMQVIFEQFYVQRYDDSVLRSYLVNASELERVITVSTVSVDAGDVPLEGPRPSLGRLVSLSNNSAAFPDLPFTSPDAGMPSQPASPAAGAVFSGSESSDDVDDDTTPGETGALPSNAKRTKKRREAAKRAKERRRNEEMDRMEAERVQVIKQECMEIISDVIEVSIQAAEEIKAEMTYTMLLREIVGEIVQGELQRVEMQSVLLGDARLGSYDPAFLHDLIMSVCPALSSQLAPTVEDECISCMAAVDFNDTGLAQVFCCEGRGYLCGGCHPNFVKTHEESGRHPLVIDNSSVNWIRHLRRTCGLVRAPPNLPPV
jgi:hypothetical protein